MDKLNSFCVIIQKKGSIVFWSKPRPADAAAKLFIDKVDQYFPDNPYFHGYAIGNTALASTKFINDSMVRLGESNPDLYRICRSIYSELAFPGDMTILLKHSMAV